MDLDTPSFAEAKDELERRLARLRSDDLPLGWHRLTHAQQVQDLIIESAKRWPRGMMKSEPEWRYEMRIALGNIPMHVFQSAWVSMGTHGVTRFREVRGREYAVMVNPEPIFI